MPIFNEESLRKHEVEYVPFWFKAPKIAWYDIAVFGLVVAFIGMLAVIFSVV